MQDDQVNRIYCGNCSAELAESPEGPRRPCLSCGSLVRRFELKAFDAILSFRDGIIIRKFLAGLSKSKGWALTIKSALPKFSHSGVPVRETQLKDKERDLYEHLVTNEDGTVLHYQRHRLTEHRGYGSAKLKPQRCEE